jgi:hypothetical protein
VTEAGELAPQTQKPNSAYAAGRGPIILGCNGKLRLFTAFYRRIDQMGARYN